MNPSSTAAAPGTMTLNDYRVRGFVPEDASTGPSTTALVLASALVVAVLAVDAYVFFGPSRSDDGSAAPATPVTAPRADITPAPTTPPSFPAMSSPVGAQPSLARVETRPEPTAEAPAPARPSAPAKATATKSPAPVASAKTTAPRKSARAESATSPATPSQSPSIDAPSATPSSPASALGVTPPALSASAPAPVVVPAEPVATAPQSPATSSN